MYDLHLLDADLAYPRPRPIDADLVEIAFADLEPLDGEDLVGVWPHEAHAHVVVRGDGRQRGPFEGGLRPEELETEEYYVV